MCFVKYVSCGDFGWFACGLWQLKPVLASYVGFQQIRATENFCVKDSNKRSDRGNPVMIYNFLLTVLSERHFQIFAN